MNNLTFEDILNAPAFVIHIEKAAERKPFFLKSIGEAGFKDIIIESAVDAHNKDDIDNALKLFKNPKIHSSVSPGGLGCLLSHLKVLTKIVQNNISVATIFEDDVFFHPHWDNLAPGYLQKTPKDFDVVFIGNQVDECLGTAPLPKRIHQLSTFCTHAYIISLKGSKKLIQLLLQWDWWSEQTAWVLPGPPALCGLFYIDIMIKNIQTRIINGQLPKNMFIWYCWNGLYYPCENNKRPLKGNDTRNMGLVFQSDSFISFIANNI